ncbi:sensor histidine kinase [Saccharicrinis sp. 156]|uniref:sensor histidine kinase n=1 Tax=Saccharicrinis sp. 156 TaxID=3417574 RepID=UPI003D34AA90
MMRYHSLLSTEDADWGERQVIRFRWILVSAILVLIGYIFLSGEVERGLISLSLAVVYIFYNSILNALLRRFKGATWIRYISSTIDVTILSLHIFNYSYFFTPIAVSTAPSLFVYAILILLSVLRYDGWLVIYTTAYVVICSNIIYFVRYPNIDPALFSQVASAGPEGAVYRSVYFILMGYFMFSIPKMINRLVEKQNVVNKERREIEIKLVLETLRKEMAMQSVMKEQQLNNQLDSHKQFIQRQNKELEKLNETKDKLFSIIGKDLRPPFCIQSSLSELLKHDIDHIDKEVMLENIKTIHRAANNALDMHSNLMDWYLTQNNALHPQPVVVNIKKMIDKVIEGQSEMWNAKGITINQSVSEEVLAYTDERMFEKVLINLISNAVKFTPNNGEVLIKANMSENDCLVEVIDNGIGMNEQQVEEIFLLNKTISSLGTNNENGTGLGLVLCKEMIDKNNGSINVNSHPGEGTHFEVSLPAGFSRN